MAVPTITVVSPADLESNVYLNKRITITFSEALDTDTINQNVFRLTHQAGGMKETCTFLTSADSKTVTMVPNRTLDANETYVLTIIGTSSSLSFYVKSATDDGLATTSRIVFTTGSDIEAYSSEKTLTQAQREGDLRLPADLTVVAGRRLKVINTTPTNHSAGIGPSLGQISIEFSGTLDTGEFDSSTMVEMNCYPLMNYGEYLAKDDGSGTIVFSKDDPLDTGGVPVDFSYPTGTWTATGDVLLWDVNEGETFPYNCEVEIVLYPSLVDIYGNTLMKAQKFVFTIEAYPVFSSVRAVERELATLPEPTQRDVIHAFVWRNSVRAWHKTNFSTIPTNYWGTLSRYAHVQTCLDILDNAELPKTILAGQKKSLGDFFVGWDANAVGKMGLKYKRLLEELEELELTLDRQIPRVVVKGGSVDRAYWSGSRAWTSPETYNWSNFPGRAITDDLPAHNTREHRSQRLPGAYDGWTT